jgi:hypothetical protein
VKYFELDLSDLNYDSHSFHDFVVELENFHYPPLEQKWVFEDTLLYLILPDLSRTEELDISGTLCRFFTWLQDQKKITSIIELSIPDNHVSPLSEDTVEQHILCNFDIHVLDWRKLDINLRFLTESERAKNSLRKLHLYSSGNWGVLYHWASKDGLLKLPHVCLDVKRA